MEASVILLLYTCRNRFDTPIDRCFSDYSPPRVADRGARFFHPSKRKRINKTYNATGVGRKMAGGHFRKNRSDTYASDLSGTKFRITAGEKEKKRDLSRRLEWKKYFALRYCVRIIDVRKVAYIVAFSRCEQLQRNKITGAFCRRKKPGTNESILRTTRRVSRNLVATVLLEYVSMKRCIVGENCDVLDTICTTVSNTVLFVSLLRFTVKLQESENPEKSGKGIIYPFVFIIN